MIKHWHSSSSQRYWCCKALLDGRTLTHRTEIREVNGWRLAAIVHVLRREYDWPIPSESRGKDHIEHYWLAKGTDKSKLRFPPSAKALQSEVAA